jgi:general secretion pathway protein F
MEFEYLSIDGSGKEFRGNLTSSDLQNARLKLREMGLTVIELKERRIVSTRKLFGGKDINDTDIYNLFKELKVLAASGINIDKALSLLISSATKPELKRALEEVLRDIKGGKSLAKAFEETGRFSPLVVVMLKVGEGVGDFRSAFENISDYLGFQIGFRSEVRNAMAYPSFLVLASVVVLVVIFKFIIPRFFSIFGQNTQALPLVAKWLYGASQLLSGWGLLAMAGFAALVVILVRKAGTGVIRDKLRDSLFRVPLLRSLILNLELSRFSYSMHTMLKSGVEFINALRLSKEVIQNRLIATEIERTIPQVKEGRGIAEAFSRVSFVPPIMLSMLAVGEASGNLKDIFFEIHAASDEKFKNAMKRVLVLVEPVIIVLMGLVVGVIVISLILTVMNVGSIKL